MHIYICSVIATTEGCGSRGQGIFFLLVSFESLVPPILFSPMRRSRHFPVHFLKLPPPTFRSIHKSLPAPLLSGPFIKLARSPPFQSTPTSSEYYDTWLWKYCFHFFCRKFICPLNISFSRNHFSAILLKCRILNK